MDYRRQIIAEFSARNKATGEIMKFRRDVNKAGLAVKQLGRSIAYAAGLGGGLYGIVRLGQSMIKSASDAEETRAKFDTVFKELAASAGRWAEQFGDSVGRASQDVESWMAGLQDTFVPLGIARKEAAELSKSLVTLAVDVASFNNKADAEVIRDFTSALVGNHETVRKYGIIISESALSQEAMNKGMNKTYAQLTDLEKVQLRYNLIQSGTTDAQGDAIRTADSYANQVKRLSGNWTELKTSMGKQLTSPLADFIKDVNWLIATGLPNLKTKYDALQRGSKGLLPEMELGRDTGDITGFEKLTFGVGGKQLPPGSVTGTHPKWQWVEQQMQRNEAAAVTQQIETVKEVTRQVKDAAKARTLALARMYDTIKIYDKQSYDAKLSLLNQEIEAFREKGIAETDIHRYELERRRQLDLEYAQKGKDIAKGFSKTWEDIEHERMTYGEVGKGTAESIHAEWVGAFQGMATEGASWSDAMKGFFVNVGNSFSNMMAQMAAEALLFDAISPIAIGIGELFSGGGKSGGSSNLATKATGPHVMHRGGIVGMGGPTRRVDPGMFASAPRLHGGLGANEFPAILEGGEEVIPKGASRAVVINLNYEGLPMAMANQSSRATQDGQVVDIWLKAADHDMRVKRKLSR